MKIRLVVSLITLVFCLQPWIANAKVSKVSCDKLSGLSIENLICQDPDLTRLDRLLGEVLSNGSRGSSATDTADKQRDEMVAAQRSWREARDDCWRAEDPRNCTLAHYEKRILELQVGFGQVVPAQQGQYVCEGAGDTPEGLSLSFYRADIPAVLAEFRGERMLLIGERSQGEGAFRAEELTLTRKRGEVTLQWRERAQGSKPAQAMHCVGSDWYSLGEPGRAPFADCYPP